MAVAFGQSDGVGWGRMGSDGVGWKSFCRLDPFGWGRFCKPAGTKFNAFNEDFANKFILQHFLSVHYNYKKYIDIYSIKNLE